MKHLYFCRHGLSEMNKVKLYSGQIETPLSEEGKEQARLAGLYAKSLDLDHIIASPYSRAHDTAKIIARVIGYPAHDIELNSLIIERHMGELEGQPWHPDMDIDGFADIETYDDLKHRVAMAYAYIKSLPADNILVVSHGATGRMFRHVIDSTVPFHALDPALREAYRFPNAQIIQML